MDGEKYILAIDSGTTSSRAIIFDQMGKIVVKCAQEIRQIYPQNGWVEQSAPEILGSVMGVIGASLAESGITAKQIAAIGITNQRETVVVWDRLTGQPIYNAIVWQCRRTADYCAQLKSSGYDGVIYDKTGLEPDAYFSASKLKWVLDNVEGARARALSGELCFGTVDTYIMWHLSGGKIFATDYTNASRTMLYNIFKLEWDSDLLTLFNIPRNMLAEVRPSSGFFGVTSKLVLGAEIPITGCAGDQQAALFGLGCTEKGSVKVTYGTGCFMLMNTGNVVMKSTHGLVTTIAAGIGEKPPYALEGSVFAGGAAVQWLRDEMRLIKSAADSCKYAMSVPDTGGVYFVPAFVGLGAPHWDSQARGLICGITRGTKKEHIIRATLESIAYQVYDLLHACSRDARMDFASLRVDGGASANDFLLQFQADITGSQVERSSCLESTALGAAYLAGLNIGYYKCLPQMGSQGSTAKVFLPSIENARREQLITGWEVAIGRARYK